jgi:tetratricopeptide (TPR) repeat protein
LIYICATLLSAEKNTFKHFFARFKRDMKYLHAGLLALMLMVMGGVYAETTDMEAIKRLVAEGKRSVALEKLDERIAASADDVEARFLKGLLLLERGDTDAARDVFEELSRRFPRLPESFNNLATIYAREGDYEKARQALLSAIANSPDYPVVRANLGDLYAKLAADAYRKAVELDPKDQASEAKLRLLDQLFAPGG